MTAANERVYHSISVDELLEMKPDREYCCVEDTLDLLHQAHQQNVGTIRCPIIVELILGL